MPANMIVNESVVEPQHQIEFDLTTLPTVWYTDYGSTEYECLHVDRITEHDVFLLILTGCMPVVEDGIEYFLRPGDIFFLKHGVHHFGRTPIEAGTSWIFIHFTVPEVPQQMEELPIQYKHQIYVNCTKEDYANKITLPKHMKATLGTALEAKIRKVTELFSYHSSRLMAYVNTAMHQLLVDIYLYSIEGEDPDSNASRVQKMIRYLNQHVAEPFSAQDLEDTMQLSYRYLGKIFLERTGLTLHECHTRIKLERACRQLKESNRPITQISDDLGFSDPLYFSHVFKKYMGMSPRAWRQEGTTL